MLTPPSPLRPELDAAGNVSCSRDASAGSAGSVPCPIVRPSLTDRSRLGCGATGPPLRQISASLGVWVWVWVRPMLDELEAEAPLDAEVPTCDITVGRRGHLHDPGVLDVQRERATDATVGADGVGSRLRRLVPATLSAQIVLTL